MVFATNCTFISVFISATGVCKVTQQVLKCVKYTFFSNIVLQSLTHKRHFISVVYIVFSYDFLFLRHIQADGKRSLQTHVHILKQGFRDPRNNPTKSMSRELPVVYKRRYFTNVQLIYNRPTIIGTVKNLNHGKYNYSNIIKKVPTKKININSYILIFIYNTTLRTYKTQ